MQKKLLEKRGTLPLALLIIGCLLVLLDGCLAHFSGATAVRLPMSSEVLTATVEEKAPQATLPLSTYAMRGGNEHRAGLGEVIAMDVGNATQEMPSAMQHTDSGREYIQFGVDGTVSIKTAEGDIPLDILQETMVATLLGATPPQKLQARYDTLTSPERSAYDFFVSKQNDQWVMQLTAQPQLCMLPAESPLFAFSLPSGKAIKRSEAYHDYIEYFANRYNLPPQLVLAIMTAESNFNPHAVSSARALGLMQVVPETAGHEVHTFLTGTPGVPDKEVLFNPESNIKYGTAYLHLLSSRHFPDVVNPASRQLCTIAAYNSGSGSVLRVFDRKRAAAIAQINALTPEELYQRLTQSMPSAEGRQYVSKVMRLYRTFSTTVEVSQEQ